MTRWVEMVFSSATSMIYMPSVRSVTSIVVSVPVQGMRFMLLPSIEYILATEEVDGVRVWILMMSTAGFGYTSKW